MTFDVEIVLRERNYAVTERLEAERTPGSWTERDVEHVLRSILAAIDRARNPEAEDRVVTLRGEEVKLTYVEFEILGALARSPGRVLSRETLLEHVWGDSEYRDPRTVDVHIRHLREKLESEPKKPEFLFTVRGVGYRFNE